MEKEINRCKKESDFLTILTRSFLLKTQFRNSHKENSSIKKTRIYNFDPLKPHFYIVKLGFTGVNIIFLIFKQKYEKISDLFLSESFLFLVVKFSMHLNRRVFVMSKNPVQ